jgi:hypothetical protein
MAGMHNARHYGLENDNETCWNEIIENKDRMKRLVDVLRLDRAEVGVDGRGLMGEKVMVFLNSVNDVDGATNGLRRAGINAVPYHAKIPLQERTSNLDKFRRYVAPTSDDDEATKVTLSQFWFALTWQREVWIYLVSLLLFSFNSQAMLYRIFTEWDDVVVQVIEMEEESSFTGLKKQNL